MQTLEGHAIITLTLVSVPYNDMHKAGWTAWYPGGCAGRKGIEGTCGNPLSGTFSCAIRRWQDARLEPKSIRTGMDTHAGKTPWT
jgi:hypothetical protein